MTVSLRHRFFLATLAASALGILVLTLVATLLLTPRVARRLVEQDARLNLMTLAASMPRGDGPARDAYLRRSNAPAWEGVELIPRGRTVPSGRELVVTVPVPDTTLALSVRPTVSLRNAMAVAKPSRWRLMGTLGAYLAFVYLLSWGLSRFVTRPLRELQSAVTALGEGERDVSVVLPKEEELAELAASFNRMACRLHQRERELAATSASLEKALQTKERIFAHTSHELRTPLTVILGYCQMLQDGLRGEISAEQLSTLDVIKRNARQLLAQVEDLLTLSRLRAGPLPMHLESVDLKDLVDEVVSNLKPLYGEQPLDVSWSREGAFPARLDYQRGCQVLSNLLDNARKYANSARVQVSLRERDGMTEVEVSDQGPGVPAEVERDIFVAFERGHQDKEGVGLGLALARELARQMGGDLRSVNRDSGATFVWSIPVNNG